MPFSFSYPHLLGNLSLQINSSRRTWQGREGGKEGRREEERARRRSRKPNGYKLRYEGEGKEEREEGREGSRAEEREGEREGGQIEPLLGYIWRERDDEGGRTARGTSMGA